MKTLKKFTFFISLFSLSSCFDLIEDVRFNDDQSGSCKWTINLSQNQLTLKSIQLLDSINGYKVPDESFIRNYFNNIKDSLELQEGISNVNYNLNFESYIFWLKYDFKDAKALNKMGGIISNKTEKNSISNNYFFETSNLFVKEFNVSNFFLNKYNKLKNEDKLIFKEANFISICRFARTIKKTENPLFKMSKSKKAIMVKTPFLDVANGNVDLNCIISLN